MAIDISLVFNQWQAAGIFDLVLPFILIFSIVFGILTATKIMGQNKGIHVMIAFVIGLMAIRTGLVQKFFVDIFPQLGVGLAVLITLVILVGLFIEDEYVRYWSWGFSAIGFIIWIIIISDVFSGVSWYSAYGLEDYAGLVVGAVLAIGLIIAIAAAKGSDNPLKHASFANPPFR